MINTNNFKGYFLGMAILFYGCCANAAYEDRAPTLLGSPTNRQRALDKQKYPDITKDDLITLDEFADFISQLMHPVKDIDSQSEHLFVSSILRTADNLIQEPDLPSLLSSAISHAAKSSKELRNKDADECMKKLAELTIVYVCLSVSHYFDIAQEEVRERMEYVYNRKCNSEAVKGIDRELHPLLNFFELPSTCVFTEADSHSFVKAVLGGSAAESFFSLIFKLAMEKKEYDVIAKAFDFEKRRVKTLSGDGFKSFREDILGLLSEQCPETYRALGPEKKQEICNEMLLRAIAGKPKPLPMRLENQKFDPVKALARLTTRAYGEVDRRLHQVEFEISKVIGPEGLVGIQSVISMPIGFLLLIGGSVSIPWATYDLLKTVLGSDVFWAMVLDNPYLSMAML